MNPDFLELLRALSDADAGFLVVGAYAVSYRQAGEIVSSSAVTIRRFLDPF